MSPITGAINGLLAYGVGKNLHCDLGYTVWQWLFITEGAMTMIFALVVTALLSPLPDTAAAKGHFLFRNERGT